MNSLNRVKMTAADVINNRESAFSIEKWSVSSMKPIAGDEIQYRASAFGSLIYSHCREQLEKNLKGTTLSDNSRLSNPSSALNLEPTLKILTCVSIHVTGIECGGADNPPWFIEYLFESLRAADAQCSAPSARSIITRYGSMRSDFMMRLVVEAVLKDLNCEQPSFVDALSRILYNDNESRLDILKMCLSGKKDELIKVEGENFLGKLASTVS